MNDPQKSEIPALMMQLLQQKRTLLVEEIMKFIAETSFHQIAEIKIPTAEKRFLKTSTFWEAGCQHMPDDKFVQFYRVTKDVFGEILEFIYHAIFKKSVWFFDGDEFLTLAHLFGVGRSSIRVAVRDFTEAIATSDFLRPRSASPLPKKSSTTSPRISSTSSSFLTASGRWTTPI